MGLSKVLSSRCSSTFSLRDKERLSDAEGPLRDWCSHLDWPEAFVLCDDTGPSAQLPCPTWLPTTKPAGVHKAQHPAGLLVGIKAEVGMFGQVPHRREPKITWHPEAKDYVHGLVRLLTLTLHGSQGELYFLPSGSGCDAISLAAESHVRVLTDLWFSDCSGKNQAITHFVYIKAGQVELWTFGHVAGKSEAAIAGIKSAE